MEVHADGAATKRTHAKRLAFVKMAPHQARLARSSSSGRGRVRSCLARKTATTPRRAREEVDDEAEAVYQSHFVFFFRSFTK